MKKSGRLKNNEYDIVLKNIAYNLRRLRKSRKWSQEKLANEADIDRTYMGHIENCKYGVGMKVLCRLAKALDADITDLFMGEIVEEKEVEDQMESLEGQV